MAKAGDKMNYEEQLKKLGNDELKKRVKICNIVLHQKLTSHSENIFKELLGESFDRYSAESILHSIIEINSLQDSMGFIENGIVNPDLAQKLDKKLQNK
tara:strand:- start:268 stop:564 length:297 start_codon:yes stop_codon:yes gene_type:complete